MISQKEQPIRGTGLLAGEERRRSQRVIIRVPITLAMTEKGIQYGPKPELPRLDASKTYQSLSLDSDGKKLWRITCFFVDRNNRRRGVSKFGVNAALASIKKKGGGIVEAYPSTKPSKGASLMWSGTVSMFAEAGFDVASQLGKSSVVMRKFV